VHCITSQIHYFTASCGIFLAAERNEFLAGLGDKRRWDFTFGEDGFKRALWDAGTAVDASRGVNEEPGPLILGLAADDAFDGADIYTSAIAQTKLSNYVSHPDMLLRFCTVISDSNNEVHYSLTGLIYTLTHDDCLAPYFTTTPEKQ
jgi:hypothetical protein